MVNSAQGKGIKEFFDGLLTNVKKFNASDLHINAGVPPRFRINGKLLPPKNIQALSAAQVEAIARMLMNDLQWAKFEREMEIDLGYGVAGVGRFRINVFKQRGTIGLAVRMIPFEVPSFASLNLPEIVAKITEYRRGLILVTGATSSGKSTTLAAMIDHINTYRACHIITIEDPIEYLFRDKKSLITQRELGVDTNSYTSALKAALRQDPDVILLGELRDLDTIETAMKAAETGHLVLSTVHTTDAAETIHRIISTFPAERQEISRIRLAGVLKAVISQRLVPRKDNRGRVLAAEIMINTGHIRDLMSDPEKIVEIPEAIAEGGSYGMQTFDQALTKLVKRGIISFKTAMEYATNPSDFALQFQGVEQGGADSPWNAVDSQPQTSTDDDFLADEFDIERF